ncbi:MAG: hypothetical protein Q8911_15685, partial [Bacillota bacterium]|nr:hypothetical protein [Bacillota bacterium]
AIVADQLPKESKNKFAYLTDSHVKNLGSGRYEVDSYVDCQNHEEPVRRIQYTMIVHWNGQRYALDDLTSEGVIKQ